MRDPDYPIETGSTAGTSTAPSSAGSPFGPYAPDFALDVGQNPLASAGRSRRLRSLELLSLRGVLPEPHEVALAVLEVGSKTHIADRHLLPGRRPAVLFHRDQGGVDVIDL